MKKKYHNAIYDYIRTGGEGLNLEVSDRTFRFRIPDSTDIEKSQDYGLYQVEQESFLLSKCLQSVGGFSVPESLKYDVLLQFLTTPKFVTRVIGYFWHCVKESHDFAPFFEAFCYTSLSRSLWEEWKNASDFGFNLFAQDFPLTDLQKSWLTYNKFEDRKEQIHDDWGRAFFVASSMNPKGVEKVQRDWDKKRKQETEYRDRLVEEANKSEYSAKSPLTEKKKEDLKSERSVEELQQEYWAWVEGREDQHDIAVRTYKEEVQGHINQRRELIQRQQKEISDMNQKVQALNSLSMSTPIRAYTDAEVAQMTQGRDRKVLNFDVDVEYAEHLSKKYLKSRQVPGKEMPSLMNQVQNRKPKYER
jgi:hypothetical protein